MSKLRFFSVLIGLFLGKIGWKWNLATSKYIKTLFKINYFFLIPKDTIKLFIICLALNDNTSDVWTFTYLELKFACQYELIA